MTHATIGTLNVEDHWWLDASSLYLITPVRNKRKKLQGGGPITGGARKKKKKRSVEQLALEGVQDVQAQGLGDETKRSIAESEAMSRHDRDRYTAPEAETQSGTIEQARA